jgi:hypothetical protein
MTLRLVAVALLGAVCAGCASSAAAPAGSAAASGANSQASATISLASNLPPVPQPTGTLPSAPSSAGPVEVDGTVASAPTCPVQRAGSSCPAMLVAGAVVVAYSGADPVARTSSDAHGRFVLHLAPGSYVLTAANPAGPPGVRSRTTVHVESRPVAVTLLLDSGIR